MKVERLQRESWYDNIRAILLFLVVTGHFAIPLANHSRFLWFWRQYITLFHMPAFLIITGVLAKRKIKEGNYFSMIESFLIPYLICDFIMFIIFTLVGASKVSGLEQTWFFNPGQAYYSFWFIIAVFFYYIVTTLIKDFKFQLPVIIAFVLLSGFGVKIRFLELSKIIPFYIFFYIGYRIDGYKMRKILSNNIIRVLSVMTLLLALIYTWKNIGAWDNSLFSMEAQYNVLGYNGVSAVLYRVIAISISIILSFAFFAITPITKTAFSVIGKYSLYPYCIQTFLMPIYFYVIDRAFVLKIDQPIEYIIAFIVCQLIIFVSVSSPIRNILKAIVYPKLSNKTYGVEVNGLERCD